MNDGYTPKEFYLNLYYSLSTTALRNQLFSVKNRVDEIDNKKLCSFQNFRNVPINKEKLGKLIF